MIYAKCITFITYVYNIINVLHSFINKMNNNKCINMHDKNKCVI